MGSGSSAESAEAAGPWNRSVEGRSDAAVVGKTSVNGLPMISERSGYSFNAGFVTSDPAPDPTSGSQQRPNVTSLGGEAFSLQSKKFLPDSRVSPKRIRRSEWGRWAEV